MNYLLGANKSGFALLINIARQIFYVLHSSVGGLSLKHTIPSKG